MAMDEALRMEFGAFRPEVEDRLSRLEAAVSALNGGSAAAAPVAVAPAQTEAPIAETPAEPETSATDTGDGETKRR